MTQQSNETDSQLVLTRIEAGDTRELAYREGEGFEVTLYWDEPTDGLYVTVNDWRTDERFNVDARPDNALDVFNHPFAYRVTGVPAVASQLDG